MKKLKDYNLVVGKTRNAQTLLEYLGYNDKGRPIFKIKCNTCTNEYIGAYYNFMDIRKIGNCCSKCKNQLYKRYPKLSLSDAQVGIIFSNYKSRAKIKKLEFNITKEEFKKLIFSNCEYCGIEPSGFRLDRIKSKKEINNAAYSNGLDRLDSSGGYILDNVVPCCEDCNKAKRNLTKKQFLNLITRIYDHQIRSSINS